MSQLAVNHLQQALIALRGGDASRAVELLEKARILSSTDADLQQKVLEQLTAAYAAVGRTDDAARCRRQLSQIRTQSSGAFGTTSKLPGEIPSRGGLPAVAYVAAAVVIVLMAIGLVFVLRPRGATISEAKNPGPVAVRPNPPATQPATTQNTPVVQAVASTISVPSSKQPVLQAAASPISSTRPTPAPAAAHLFALGPVTTRVPPAPPTPTTAPVASAATASARQPKPITPIIAKIDRQELLRDNVGLCVIVARYEGPVGNRNALLEFPIGSGTAFCISSSGLLLTNRHVVETAGEAKLPPDLKDSKLPEVTFRGISYIVCFGPEAKDHYTAKVIHRSEQFDMALLRISRHVDRPLLLAAKPPRQGDDILACGYPGLVMEAFNDASMTPAHAIAVSHKWQKTLHVEAFDEFSPDSFSSTLTKGIVSAPERTLEGASYMQIDAAISPGNSGGPVLNSDNEVVGIATWHLRAQSAEYAGLNYNFALRVGQLAEEVQPYLHN